MNKTIIGLSVGLVAALGVTYAVRSHKANCDDDDEYDRNHADQDEPEQDPMNDDYDSEGYHKDTGYNPDGYDRGKKTADYYTEELTAIDACLSNAHKWLEEFDTDNQDALRYACLDIRTSIESCTRYVIEHKKGTGYIDSLRRNERSAFNYIHYCKDNALLLTDLTYRLSHANHLCNQSLHNIHSQLEYREVECAYEAACDLRNEVEKFTQV